MKPCWPLAKHLNKSRNSAFLAAKKVSRTLKTFSQPAFHHTSLNKFAGMELNDVVSKLNEFAPISLAEKWDNVGLLVQPFTAT